MNNKYQWLLCLLQPCLILVGVSISFGQEATDQLNPLETELISKLVEKNPDWSGIRALSEPALVSRVTELNFFSTEKTNRLIVISFNANCHWVVSANQDYKVRAHKLGAGPANLLRMRSGSEPFECELLTESRFPCHYRFLADGTIETIFASRTGIVREEDAERSRTYLESFSWPKETSQGQE